MFGMGMTEILVILVVAMLFLGPEKLPDAAKKISRGIRDLRKQTKEFQDTIENDTQIGGAIRDLKSALRGDDFQRPPVRKKIVDKPVETAAVDSAVGATLAAAAEVYVDKPGTDGAPAAVETQTDAPVAPEPAGAAESADAPAAEDAAPAPDDDLAKLIRPATGSIGRGQPN